VVPAVTVLIQPLLVVRGGPTRTVGGFHRGLTFIHLASHDEDDAADPLPDLDAFRRFREGVRERCEEAPVASEAKEICLFRLFPR
jgi:hypothetical protein